MAWIEVPKNEVYSKLENGVNLAIAIFPDNTDYNANSFIYMNF